MELSASQGALEILAAMEDAHDAHAGRANAKDNGCAPFEADGSQTWHDVVALGPSQWRRFQRKARPFYTIDVAACDRGAGFIGDGLTKIGQVIFSASKDLDSIFSHSVQPLHASRGALATV